MKAEANELAALKSAATTFGGDERFTMLGIAVYGSPEVMKKYSEENGMTWTAATVQAKGSAMSSFGIRQFPLIWLVGPDGNVVAKDLHGDGIKNALTSALGPQGM
jgi:hypothetical protein